MNYKWFVQSAMAMEAMPPGWKFLVYPFLAAIAFVALNMAFEILRSLVSRFKNF